MKSRTRAVISTIEIFEKYVWQVKVNVWLAVNLEMPIMRKDYYK